MLLEPAVTVHARRKDSDVIQKAVDGSKQAYKDISGKDVSIQIEESLSDDS
jgi:V-type H+-transporting ATPase subunit E